MIFILLNDFAVVGGDRRFFCLAKLLCSRNFNVVGFALDIPKDEDFSFKMVNSLKKAIKTSKNLIFPIPFSRDGVLINSSIKNSDLKIRTFLKCLKKNNVVFAGNFDSSVSNEIKKRAGFVFDYLQDKEFAILNACLTAEAAIAQAVLKSPFSLHFSSCLVLGFGRCGKTIALKLKGLCKNVVVAVSGEVNRAWAVAMGFDVLSLNDLETHLSKFNFVFNTIPARILSGSLLKNFNSKVFVLDITQDGIDLNEFKKNLINAETSLQIPGKFKFEEAAKILADLTIKVLKSTEN